MKKNLTNLVMGILAAAFLAGCQQPAEGDPEAPATTTTTGTGTTETTD